MIHDGLHGRAHSYISDLLVENHSTRTLRSSAQCILQTKKRQTQNLGTELLFAMHYVYGMSFPVAFAVLALFSGLKKRLKIYLFK